MSEKGLALSLYKKLLQSNNKWIKTIKNCICFIFNIYFKTFLFEIILDLEQ